MWRRVHDSLDGSLAARRALLGVPPFFTGKQKLVDTGGRVERFNRRLERRSAPAKGRRSAKATKAAPAEKATAEA